MNIRFLVALLCFASCMSSKKLAEQCKEKFPCEVSKSDTVTVVKERIETDTIHTEGETVFVTDTMQCPTSVEPITIIRQVQAKCPESQVIEKVRFVETEKTITIEVLDSSANYLHRVEVWKLTDTITELRARKPFWFGYLLGVLSVVALLALILCIALKRAKNKLKG